ncbi:MAG: glycoside hydrolase family 25 protein [Firmicutes bacterium]|nr:glycoside hydrolase family 25 protein [Bacillota bacterium]
MRRRIALLAAMLLVLSALMSGCSMPWGGKDNNNVNNANETEVQEPQVTFTVSDLKKYADRSTSLWEMMGFIFPDCAVYKDAAGKYVIEPAKEGLERNKYDWSDMSKAIRGIDVSKYQGTIDWRKVAFSDVRFAFIRIGYRGYETGKMVMDETFRYNIENALANGIPVGVYFVTKATSAEEGREEAQWIINNIRAYNVTWPVVMDFEGAKDETDRTYGMSADTRDEVILAFCDTLREAGYTPMLYGSIGTYMTKMHIEKLEGINRWFAMYFNEPHFPYSMQIWQATDSGKVDGIKGDVDIDYTMFNYSTGEDTYVPEAEAEAPAK